MDGFSGTKCGTGLQKKWWGDKEPSDKSSIWYKGGCPFVYDASTKSWAPQSTSGGGSGSLTGLALLKAFIDSHNPNKYDYTGVTIGVKSEAVIYINKVDVLDYINRFSYFRSTGSHIIAFNLEHNLFFAVNTYSGNKTETYNFIFFVVDYDSTDASNTSIVVKMPDPMSNEYTASVQALIDNTVNGTAVNYDDLK